MRLREAGLVARLEGDDDKDVTCELTGPGRDMAPALPRMLTELFHGSQDAMLGPLLPYAAVATPRPRGTDQIVKKGNPL